MRRLSAGFPPVRDSVNIVEVSPRDGLQNEAQFVATEDKLALIEKLLACGLRTIEATAFVSPKWVPQMRDAAELYPLLPKHSACRFPVLVPNIQGYERAHACGVTDIAVFTAASEAFTRKNINASIAESLERFKPVFERARHDGVSVRGYVSTVLGCTQHVAGGGRRNPDAIARRAFPRYLRTGFGQRVRLSGSRRAHR
jgi:hydroxymethylglutaryl-CoA lyase